ncbi:MAG TPA: hypothetical protein PKX17_05845 [Candidatus Methanomethylicus sp.]|nr:hypothetical protein [Candidatus Methanomethylicus sp.]
MALSLHKVASKKKARVAIGLDTSQESAEKVINSALFAKREGYIEPVLVSGNDVGPEIDKTKVVGTEMPLVVEQNPETVFIRMIRDGAVDAGVRGNMSSKKVIPLLRSEFLVDNLCRVSVLEVANRLVLLAPVGIEEGETMNELVAISENCEELASKLEMPLNVAVLSGGRLDDYGRSPKVDKLLSESKALTSSLAALGFKVTNYGIEIERALADGVTMLIAPDGIFGNLIFRSMVLIGGIESYGAVATALPRVYIDTSRAKGSFLLPMILAGALSRQ